MDLGIQAFWIVIPLLWLGYGSLHSLLASLGLKSKLAKRWPASARFYRLGYNLLALVLLLPILDYIYSLAEPALWSWSGPWRWAQDGVLLLSLLGFVVVSRAYDMLAFAGLRGEAQMKFQVAGLHRLVRHPWYFFALCILWSRDMNAASLLQTGCITAYFIVGSLMEERRLVASIGSAYEIYRSMVPGLVPMPGRFVSADAMEQIASAEDRGSGR